MAGQAWMQHRCNTRVPLQSGPLHPTSVSVALAGGDTALPGVIPAVGPRVAIDADRQAPTCPEGLLSPLSRPRSRRVLPAG
jgi:hypothetical protein